MSKEPVTDDEMRDALRDDELFKEILEDDVEGAIQWLVQEKLRVQAKLSSRKAETATRMKGEDYRSYLEWRGRATYFLQILEQALSKAKSFQKKRNISSNNSSQDVQQQLKWNALMLTSEAILKYEREEYDEEDLYRVLDIVSVTDGSELKTLRQIVEARLTTIK